MLEIKKVGIYVFPQVEELDFVGVYEILAKTNVMKNEGKLPIETSLLVDILASEELITCANGLMIKPHFITDIFEGYDLLIIPGGRGVNKLIENKQLLKNIENFAKNHIICSVCTGSLVLGAAGLLKGKKAATHHESRDALREYCDVTNLRVYRDGNIIWADYMTECTAPLEERVSLFECCAVSEESCLDALKVPPPVL